MEIARVRWPDQAALRSELDLARLPRLLLINAGDLAPRVTDVLEDWVRLPASDADMEVRERKLALLATSNSKPRLDDHGLLWVGDQWQAVPPVEAALVGALLANMGDVVDRNALSLAAWPDEDAARNALDVRILRLRRRIEPLGLSIRTVRSRGYLLEFAPNR